MRERGHTDGADDEGEAVDGDEEALVHGLVGLGKRAGEACIESEGEDAVESEEHGAEALDHGVVCGEGVDEEGDEVDGVE